MRNKLIYALLISHIFVVYFRKNNESTSFSLGAIKDYYAFINLKTKMHILLFLQMARQVILLVLFIMRC
jgi:hypothetical protein